MSYIGRNCVSVLFFINVIVIAVFYKPAQSTVSADPKSEILTDYYWGSRELRADKRKAPPSLPSKPQPLSCDSEILQIICFNKCGADYVCQRDTCKCRNDGETLKVTLRFAKEDNIFKDNKYTYSNEDDMPLSLRSAINADQPPKEVQLEDLLPPPPPPRPALRHHIAHFCPSIKKAKTCIRTCMKKGLPAFCGKDHVCYCGHRYTAHDNNTQVDVNDVYSQFRDIYTKYFGPKIFDMEASADEEEGTEGTAGDGQ